MAGIVYELIEVLEEQKECYEGLSTLSDYTQTAVVNKNLEFLNEVVKTQEQFTGRLSVLEKKREGLMKDIAIVTGMDYKEITITKLIQKLGSENEAANKLELLKKEIKELLDELSRKSDLNKMLLEQSLELVNFTINAIESTKGYSYVGNYNRPGEEMSVERQQSIFDTKQ